MHRRLNTLLLLALLLSVATSATAPLIAAESAPTQPAAPPTPAEPKPLPTGLTNARATMDRFLTQMNAGNYARAAECLDFSNMGQISQTQREDLAWKLKESLDRIQVIDLDEIGTAADGKPYVFRAERDLPAIEIERDDRGVWRFSPETTASIESLYEQVRSRPVKAGRHWLRDLFPASLTAEGFLLPLYQWICLAVVIFLGLIVDMIARFLLNRATRAWMKVWKISVEGGLSADFWKPMGLLARAVTWYAGMVIIGLPPQVLGVLMVAVKLFTVVAAVWTAFRLIDLLSRYLLKKASGTSTKFDDLFVPLVSRSLKVFSACVGVVTLADSLNLPIAGLLGGLGLGGAALAFAAKDSLANVFGSVTVLVDRPFEIGDWIITQGVEGSVEEVGIRSTRVRTFYNSLITVPNSLLITAVVDNMGKRRYRRIKTTLGLQYDTPPERIDAFCEGVRELIRRHPYTRKDYYHVYFNDFADSSLNVMLYCFVECPDWSVELRERHRLLIDILKLAQRLGVSFAFPTRTLHMFPEEPTPPDERDFSAPEHVGRGMASDVAGPPLSPGERPGGVEFPGPSGD